jgi:fucose permease
MGFTGSYFLISIAAPAFLKKRGELKTKDIALCVAAVLLLIIPAAGLVYPVPAPPVNAFPYVFGAYLFIGYARIMAMQHQKPQRVEEISLEVKKLHVATA